MAALSHRAFADLVSVSHQAIGKALRRGHLVRIDGSTRLDPEAPANREWIERRARRARPKPAPPIGAEPAPAAPTPVGPKAVIAADQREGTLPLVDGLFSDWTALRIDRDAADRLLAQVPAERTDQIAFLTLMMEGLRGAVAEALEVQRTEILALWAAALEGRRTSPH